MMKKPLILLSILFSFSDVSAQGKLTNHQKVQNTVIDMFQALADLDTVKLLSYCTDDIEVLENGVRWTSDTLKLKISQTKPEGFKRVNTFDFMDIMVKGKVAWTTYHNRADITRNGKQGHVRWLETAILVREKRSWKIKVLHSTLLERT
jgi:ketosteroid isomerase-like protein